MLPLIGAVPQPITSAIGIIAAIVVAALLVVCAAGVMLFPDPRRMLVAGAIGVLSLAVLLLVIGSSNLVLGIVVALLGACLLALIRAGRLEAVPAVSLIDRRSVAGALASLALLIALVDGALSTRWPQPIGRSIAEGIGDFFGSTGIVALGITAVVLLSSMAAFAVLVSPVEPERHLPSEPLPRPRRRSR